MTENGVGIDIPPAYCSFLREASHLLYCALNRMKHTPCVTKDQFETVIGIYSDLGDFIDGVSKRKDE